MDNRVELRIWLFGQFRVALGEHVIDGTLWRRRKAKSLVKLLALAGGRLHREQVLDALWPELEQDAALNNLHQTLHVARRILDPGGNGRSRYLQLEPDLLRLCPDGCLWTDVAAFEAAAREARRGHDLLAYQQALALYTGDLLPDDCYEEWAAGRREALRQQYLELLLGQAQLAEARADIDTAVESLQRVLAIDATHEAAHAGLMRAYAQSGRRQQALRQYLLLERRLADELAAEPAVATRELFEAILGGRVPAARPTAPAGGEAARPAAEATAPWPARHNLPAALSRFIGRSRERGEVRRLLRDTRLLTLTGPGGCGKTRLALEVGGELLPHYPDGVWLAELASIDDPSLVPGVVAAALGVREYSSRPLITTLTGALGSRRLLLILDNCEHLLDACAGLVETLLRACPRLSILTTSREPLHVPGEVVWLVPSLALPDPRRLPPLEHLLAYEAVQLFVDRAMAIDPGFTVRPEDAPALAEICYRLDGMPLAIELAAARVKVLSLPGIAERLDDCFRLLGNDTRAGLTRQQTLRATLDWSHDLLTQPERVLFRRLATFAGGFDLEAAETVCAGDGIEPAAVLDLLSRLVDKSLVAVERPASEVRYRLLIPIRQFALEKLSLAGEQALMNERHLAYYLSLAETGEAQIRGGGQVAWLARLELDHDNFRAALSRSRGAAGDLHLQLAGALFLFWHLHGHLAEGRAWLEAALRDSTADQPPDAGETGIARKRARAKALYGAGALTAFQSEIPAAVLLLKESRALYLELGDQHGVAYPAQILAGCSFYAGDYARARAELEWCVAAHRAAGDQWWLAFALFTLGDAVMATDPEAARPFFEESLAISRRIGDFFGMAISLTSLGKAALYQGDAELARRLIEEGLALRRQTGQKWFMAISLTSLGDVARYQGRLDEAEALYREALALFRELDTKLDIAWGLYSLGCIAKRRGDSEAAAALFLESLALEERLALERQRGDPVRLARCLVGLAGARLQPASDPARAEQAAHLLGTASTLLTGAGARLSPPDQLDYERDLAAIRGVLDPATFDRAFEQGRQRAVDETIDRLLSGQPPLGLNSCSTTSSS